MEKLISFNIYAEKGFLKKPDINDGLYLTFNMLHKPALLGILGAIAGLPGYKKNGELPEYYIQLNTIPVGIMPLNDEKGNFQKTIISYNNTTGLASDEEGGNLIITEQTLIAPAFKIYLLLNTENLNELTLYNNIKNQQAEFLPYLGKNDYSIWWNKDEVAEYEWEKVNVPKTQFTIDTIFNKCSQGISKSKHDNIPELDMFNFESSFKPESFMCFERIPVCFNKELMQYAYADFAFTNFELESTTQINNLYCLNHTNYVQLN